MPVRVHVHVHDLYVQYILDRGILVRVVKSCQTFIGNTKDETVTKVREIPGNSCCRSYYEVSRVNLRV